MVTSRLPDVSVEHVGSTAVPGCGGKGIVDVMVLYPDGALDQVKQVLNELGFQRQTVGHIFGEDRPMRVGALEHEGDSFRIHAHVISAHSPEVLSFRAFRDRLRAEPQFMAAYVACKSNIVAAGVKEPAEYTRRKSEFIIEASAG